MLKKKRSKQIDYEEEYEDEYEDDDTYTEYAEEYIKDDSDGYTDEEYVEDKEYADEDEDEYEDEDEDEDEYEKYEDEYNREDYEEYTPPVKKSKQTKKSNKKLIKQKPVKQKPVKQKPIKQEPTKQKKVKSNPVTTRNKKSNQFGKTPKKNVSNTQPEQSKQPKSQSPAKSPMQVTQKPARSNNRDTKNVVIDLDLPDVIQKRFLSVVVLQDYVSRKFKKIANQSSITLEIYDEQRVYSPLETNESTSIEIDFHEKALDITSLALMDIRNNFKEEVKEEVKPKEVKMDIDDYKDEVLNKSKDFNEEEYDQFFNETDNYDPSLSEVITPFVTQEETPVDIDSTLKLEEDDFNFMESFDNILEENTEFEMIDPDEMLIFGVEESETYTTNAPIKSTTKRQQDNTVRAGINTTDALLQQVSGEDF